MKLLCNECKKIKNIKKENYKKMLKKFSFSYSAIYGMSKGISDSILKGTSHITKKLSPEAIEIEFIKTYKCRNCRNKKTIIKELLDKLQTSNPNLNPKPNQTNLNQTNLNQINKK